MAQAEVKPRPFRICPRCGKAFDDFPALSRVDNLTEICPTCGFHEAVESFAGRLKRKSGWKHPEPPPNRES